LSESGYPGFKDLQDKDFVGCVRFDDLVIMKRFLTSDAPADDFLSASGFTGFKDFVGCVRLDNILFMLMIGKYFPRYLI
jgi:hypothetical protein